MDGMVVGLLVLGNIAGIAAAVIAMLTGQSILMALAFYLLIGMGAIGSTIILCAIKTALNHRMAPVRSDAVLDQDANPSQN